MHSAKLTGKWQAWIRFHSDFPNHFQCSIVSKQPGSMCYVLFHNVLCILKYIRLLFVIASPFLFVLVFWQTHSHVLDLFFSHWYPCFGFLVKSPLGIKVRVGSALLAFAEANVMYIPWDPSLVLYIASLLMVSIVGWEFKMTELNPSHMLGSALHYHWAMLACLKMWLSLSNYTWQLYAELCCWRKVLLKIYSRQYSEKFIWFILWYFPLINLYINFANQSHFHKWISPWKGRLGIPRSSGSHSRIGMPQCMPHNGE